MISSAALISMIRREEFSHLVPGVILPIPVDRFADMVE